MALRLAFFFVAAAPSFAHAPGGTAVSAVRLVDVAPGEDGPRPEGPKPRVVISADFPPLDVIPGGAGHGPAEKRSDPDDVQSMVRFLLYTNAFDIAVSS